MLQKILRDRSQQVALPQLISDIKIVVFCAWEICLKFSHLYYSRMNSFFDYLWNLTAFGLHTGMYPALMRWVHYLAEKAFYY